MPVARKIESLERFQEKWTRFSVRKRDQIGNLEHFHESINLGNALASRQEKTGSVDNMQRRPVKPRSFLRQKTPLRESQIRVNCL